jgi:hypothetical protein
MKKVSQSVDNKLLSYLDGKLSKEECEKIESELGRNQDWKARLDELRLVTSTLKEMHLEFPSKNFTLSVMGKLNVRPADHGFSLRNGILLLTGVLVAVGIAVFLVSAGMFDNATGAVDLNQIELSKKYLKTPLPSFEYSGKLIVNFIIFLNLGLAWLILDRVILRPYFERRIQRSQ